MLRTRACLSLVALSLTISSQALAQEAAKPERVTLPLALWQRLRAELRPSAPASPPAAWSSLDRRVTGSFRKGLFEATLEMRFEVLDPGGYTEVPVIDAGASLTSVTLDDDAAFLRRDEALGMYVIGLGEPGTYRVRVHFLLGREEDRFARRLRFQLPASGPTHLSIGLPERDIEARLGQGVLTAQRSTAAGTRLEGQVDATGTVDLEWTRKVTHENAQVAKLEVRQSTLFTVSEALVTGVTMLAADTPRG